MFGDQLDSRSAAFDGFDTGQDAVLMMEVKEEATYIPQHKLRLAFFFSAMRHFAEYLKGRNHTVYYVMLGDPKEPIRDRACPFTTLYWDFLLRNRNRLKKNPRMGLQFRNLDRKSQADRKKIRKTADRLKSDLTRKTYL